MSRSVATPETSWRHTNVGRALFSATDRLVREKLHHVHRRGFDTVSVALVAVFQNVDVDGTRLTQIAARARLTKQSTLELVDKAEALGFVERRPDPDDGRAKIVVFTPLGLKALHEIREGVLAAEERLAVAIGRKFLREAKVKLATDGEILNVLSPITDNPRMSVKNDAWRINSASRVFAEAADRFAYEMLQRLDARGAGPVPQALLSLFMNMDMWGTRPTELAARARLTKQAMQELVERAEASGWVLRRPDRTDGRAKVVMFTAKGVKLLAEIGICVRDGERRMAKRLGRDFVAELATRLNEYASVRKIVPVES